MRFGNSIILPEVGVSPGTPPSGGLTLFAKTSDSRLYYKNDSGVEYGPLDGLTPVPSNMVTTDTTQSITGSKTFTTLLTTTSGTDKFLAQSMKAPLKTFLSAAANVAYTPVDIMFVGDSFFEGTGQTAEADRVAVQFMNRIKAAQPTSITGGIGYLPARRAASTMPTPYTSMTGTYITYDSVGPAGRGYRLSSGATVNYTVTGTSVDVFYTTGTAGGILQVTIDGVPQTTINTNAATGVYFNKAHYDFGAVGSHTVTVTANSNYIYYEGIFVYNGDENAGFRYWDFAHSGYTSTQYVTFAQLTGLPFRTEVTNITPELVFLCLGANDFAQNIPSATTKANLLTLIGEIRAGYPDASIVLVGIYDLNPSNTTPLEPWENYATAARQIADADAAISFIDLAQRMSSSTGDTLGLFYDLAHPNKKGAAFAGLHLAMGLRIPPALFTAASAAGGGTAPTNMVTTDTTQTITGYKTMSNPFRISYDNPMTGTSATANGLEVGSRAGFMTANGNGTYVMDQVYYNGSAWIARNTGTNLGYLALNTGGFSYGSYAGGTTAGSAYAMTTRFTVTTSGVMSVSGTIQAQGITGAQSNARWVGATSTGAAPASGTFLLGDFVISQPGRMFVASTAGTPGTWTEIGANVGTAATFASTVNAVGGVSDNGNRVYSLINKVPVVGLSATGTADSTTFLRGDGTWTAVSGGSTAANVVTSANATANKFTVLPLATPPAAPVAGDVWIVSDADAYVGNPQQDLQPVLNRQGKAMALLSPNMPPARTPTPTITLAVNTPDAATPTQILPNTITTGTALNPAFHLSGNATYMAGGTVYPDYQSIRQTPLPSNPATYGRAAVDFYSDAPAISFKHYRSQGGYTRISVDGVEAMMIGPATASGTATAGTTSSITLAAGSSAASGYYITQWVHIISGTGTGQYAQISAYNGSTRVATVTPNWTTTPDATSVYEVTQQRLQYTNTTNLSGVDYYFKLDWNGERRFRHYRVEEDSQGFWGCWTTGVTDSVYPALTADGMPTIWCGDSFGAGTGANLWMGALSKIACDQLGWGLTNTSVGGTGFLNSGPNSLVFRDRLLPPLNSWQIFTRTATGGTFTLTQNGITTAAISYTATLAQIQTILDNAFGASTFKIAGQDAQSFFLIGLGANATFAGAMTANWTSMTGGPQYLVRYVGDLASNLPKDGNGNPLEFNLVLQGLHNDTVYNNAAWTNAVLQAEVDYVVQSLTALYPTMNLYMVGMMYLPGSGASDGNILAANTVGLNSMTNYARRINGKVPFVNTLTPSWATGSGYAGALAGNGNSDILTWTDGVHPSPYGHYMYGSRIAQTIMSIASSE